MDTYGPLQTLSPPMQQFQGLKDYESALEAVIVLLEAVRMVKSVRVHLKAIRVLVEAVIVNVYP